MAGNWMIEMLKGGRNRAMQGWYGNLGFSPPYAHTAPGYTQSAMMTNQGPVGEPTQDPRQFDPPFRAPYGQGRLISSGDVGEPLYNAPGTGSYTPGQSFFEALVDPNWGHSRNMAIVDEIDRRTGNASGENYDMGTMRAVNRQSADYGQRMMDSDPFGQGIIRNARILQMTDRNEYERQALLEAAKREAEMALKNRQMR